MGLIVFIVVYFVLLSFSLVKLFEKAGLDGKRALIPGKNMGDLAQIVGRKRSHAWWLLFPIVNIFIMAGLLIDLVRSFGKYDFIHSTWAVIAGPIYNFILGRDFKVKYLGPSYAMEKEYKQKVQAAKKSKNKIELQRLEAKSPYKKSTIREWSEAIIFAVFAATFIRMFLLEAFMIPTGSMESSLMTGDFLFVSKVHYGIRTPQTIAMLPLVHNRSPFGNAESYLENPKLNYYRLPKISAVKRNDAVVFNYPEGDSVYVLPGRTWSKYDLERGNLRPEVERYIRNGNVNMATRPMDKADHYIKRCVAVPGDKLEVRSRQLYINDEKAVNPEKLQYSYIVKFNGAVNRQKLADLEISASDLSQSQNNTFVLNLTEQQKETIKSWGKVNIQPIIQSDPKPEKMFPHDPKHFNFALDDYGPIVVPKKGETVRLSPENIALYRRIIDVYEDNDFSEKNGKFVINGAPTNEYTFKYDYYWMMGDNRHNSEDSRFWGFVPETHIVGKPMFIWMSLRNGQLKDGIRWDRVMTGANKF